eukprot:CAMPEP_0118892364 /NCGR_PEP_ID=MMETSP1166-20130328/1992_1 /TAXON_ID=1104430 /ORGANISM="Chrysoreinhardia sp, Strain CCMP3193" /LENGTH=609 /DNA_ID=CAMNT_0006831079 /DNA_START=29 /DNA_END=1861 /DNA_ORIENTATION=+
MTMFSWSKVVVWVVAWVVVALADEERRAAIMSRPTLEVVREVLRCEKKSEKEILFVIGFGRDRDRLEKDVGRSFRGGEAVASASVANRRLWGAAETDGFDFSQFDDYDVVVGGLVAFHWPELLATYPRATLLVVRGDPVRPVPAAGKETQQTARLERCASEQQGSLRREQSLVVEVDARVTRWGSGCPSNLQVAKIEDQNLDEILSSGLDQRLEVRDLRRDARRFDVRSFVGRPKPGNLIVGAGMGATATKSMAKALRTVGVDDVDHYDKGKTLLKSAAEDDFFPFGDDKFRRFGALLDTPVPGFWLELFAAFQDAKVILTVRDVYDRDYSSRFHVKGTSNDDWRNAKLRANELWTMVNHLKHKGDHHQQQHQGRRRRLFPDLHLLDLDEEEEQDDEEDEASKKKTHQNTTTCKVDYCIDVRCAEIFEAARVEGRLNEVLERVAAIGDKHCRLGKPLDVVDEFAVKPAKALLAHESASLIREGLRVPVYASQCPSLLTAIKTYHNHNRHVIRTTPKDRLLVMDILKGDGFDKLCPFLQVDHCPTGPFPHSKNWTLTLLNDTTTTTTIPEHAAEERRLSSLAHTQHTGCICDAALEPDDHIAKILAGPSI